MPKDGKPPVQIGRGWAPPLGFDPTKAFKQRVPNVTHELHGRGVMFFSFKISLSDMLRESLLLNLLKEHGDYVEAALWLLCGRLKVVLRPPRRDSDPDLRRNARLDMPIIVNQLYDQMTSG